MIHSVSVVIHHARLFGLPAEAGDGNCDIRVGNVKIRMTRVSMPSIKEHMPDNRGHILQAVAGKGLAWERLRSFHALQPIDGFGITPVVVDGLGRIIWGWDSHGGGVLHIGTDLGADLTLIRQGDPAAAANRPTETKWGIAGERPNYLFEDQLEADRPQERLADWWMWTLRDALCNHGGIKAHNMLPFGAPGAVVITGDDDQAPLNDYREQAAKLGALPITYFLHPLTKHDAATLAQYSEERAVEWELHPDALETPSEYRERLSEQCRWFNSLTGRRPRLLRNHGFLNDGYWGHYRSWNAEGIIGSSNIPGVDGQVVNGSLLPARLTLGGELTTHWSLLTTFGDGVFFVYHWSEEKALGAIQDMAEQIIASKVPGLIVLNLHPANHEKAASMHEVAHRLVGEMGFAAMNLSDTIRWFADLETGSEGVLQSSMIRPGSITRKTPASKSVSPYDGGRSQTIGMFSSAVDAVFRLIRRGTAV